VPSPRLRKKRWVILSKKSSTGLPAVTNAACPASVKRSIKDWGIIKAGTDPTYIMPRIASLIVLLKPEKALFWINMIGK
jgi:hypothetical protein